MPTEYMTPEERAFAAALALGLGPDDQAALLGYLMRQENDALERAAQRADGFSTAQARTIARDIRKLKHP